MPRLPWQGMNLPCCSNDISFFANAMTTTVEDGTAISFWNDSWENQPPPRQLWPSLYALSRRKNRSLQAALHKGTWLRNLQGRVTAQLLPAFLDLRPNANPRIARRVQMSLDLRDILFL